MISLKTSSPVAAPSAADSGSKRIDRVSGMNRKYSTENSTIPTWKDGISSVIRVARPYRDMVRTNTISFCDWVMPYALLFAGFMMITSIVFSCFLSGPYRQAAQSRFLLIQIYYKGRM